MQSSNSKIVPALLVLGLLAAALMISGPYLPSIGLTGPQGPIAAVIAVEESADRANHREQTEALTGTTSQALRKADKFRLFDKDRLPDAVKPLYAKLSASDLPYLWIVRGQQIVWKGPVPNGEKGMADLITKEGGY